MIVCSRDLELADGPIVIEQSRIQVWRGDIDDSGYDTSSGEPGRPHFLCRRVSVLALSTTECFQHDRRWDEGYDV